MLIRTLKRNLLQKMPPFDLIKMEVHHVYGILSYTYVRLLVLLTHLIAQCMVIGYLKYIIYTHFTLEKGD